MTVVVLGGGDSTEREVSIRSAKAVSQALVSAGYEVINLDPIKPAVLDTIVQNTIVFPILHGNNCEDGKIQRELELRNLPFLASESKSSVQSFDKVKTLELFRAAGLPVAKGDSVTKESYATHSLSMQPHVLKISEGGSSIGTYLVPDPNAVRPEKVAEVFELGSIAVIEEFIHGVEITVPILDGKSLPVIEIKPPENEEFDYANKYNGKTQEICPATSISADLQKKAQNYAEQAHKVMGCRHLSRVDMIVRPDGTMVLLEINTMPGMTDQSLYPLSAKVAGMEFPKLMEIFVDLVRRDYAL